MKKAVRLATLFALLGILVVLSWVVRTHVRPQPDAEAIPPEAHSQAIEPPARMEARPEDSAREPAQASPVESVVTPDAPPHTPSLAEIRGRFLFPDGSAASGVVVSVLGTAGNQERAEKFGIPKEWSVPPATSGSDGRFSISLDPPPAFQFFVDATLDGYCKENWRWGEIEVGATKDLGDVVLRRGGSVAGRIVDAKGRPVHQDWMVYAEGAYAGDPSGREPVRGRAKLDETAGEFRIEDLAPGPVQLKAYSKIANWIVGPSVEIRAGEVAQADIRYEGPDLGSRITVVLFAQPVFALYEAPPEIMLRAPGFEERKAEKVKGSSQSYAFEDVPPGHYTVAIEDPRFQAWSAADVEPGRSLNAKLKGSASLRLTVIDSKTGERVPHYSATVRFDQSRWRPNTSSLLPKDTDPPADGLLEGLISGSQTLIVGAPGYADLVIEIADLQPNEVREITARMSQGASLAGRVVQGPAKKPVPEVDVHLVPAVPRDSPIHVLPSRKDPSVRSTRSDEGGRFAFTMLPAGTFDVVVEWKPGLVAEVDAVALGATEANQDVELVLPAVGRLHGKLIGADGATFEGLALSARPARESTNDDVREAPTFRFWTPPQDLRKPIGADGSFRIEPLEAGEIRVTLEFPMPILPNGFSGSSSGEGVSVDLGTIQVPPDVDTEHDFDLRSSFPGTVRFTATLAGAPAVGAVVEVLDESEWTPTAAAAVLDDHGRARIGPLPPRSYGLVLRAVDTEWFYCAPVRLEIRAGTESAASVDVPLASGELKVVDSGSGEPFASPQLLIRLEVNPRSPAATIRTDAEGRAKIRLPPARYTLGLGFDHDNGRSETIAFDWTDHGSSPPILKLRKPSEPK